MIFTRETWFRIFFTKAIIAKPDKAWQSSTEYFQFFESEMPKKNLCFVTVAAENSLALASLFAGTSGNYDVIRKPALALQHSWSIFY